MFSDKVTIEAIRNKKGVQKITMLTCYDASFARILDMAGIDIVLVGDSMANVVLGMENTREVSFEEMFEHTRAVKRSLSRSLLVADMPYVSCRRRRTAVRHAEKFIKEAGADAVKIEWFDGVQGVLEAFMRHHVPVMGHVGLTPQTADELGGMRVQGKDARRAQTILRQAELFAQGGAFSIVVECVPTEVSRIITEQLPIPTIGIGAGNACDGQVLVLYDMLGLYQKIEPKFVRRYADLSGVIKTAVEQFIQSTHSGNFPSERESFSISAEELDRLRRLL